METQLCWRGGVHTLGSVRETRKKRLPPPHGAHLCLRDSDPVISPCSSIWCPASPCPRTCPQRRPPTYLRPLPRPRPPSHPWLPCHRCHQYWVEPTSPAWEPCADATRTNTPCLCRRVGPTTQHCPPHRSTDSSL